MTVRDATANNLADTLDFTQAPRAPVTYRVPEGPFATFCPPLTPDKWRAIAELARLFGWVL